MKQLSLIAVFCLFAIAANAQNNNTTTLQQGKISDQQLKPETDAPKNIDLSQPVPASRESKPAKLDLSVEPAQNTTIHNGRTYNSGNTTSTLQNGSMLQNNAGMNNSTTIQKNYGNIKTNTQIQYDDAGKIKSSGGTITW